MHQERIYKSGTSDALGVGWDVMQVIYKQDGVAQGSVLLARDICGTIMRKTDLVLERWEIITDEGDLRACQRHYDERDRLTIEKADRATA